MLNRTLKEKYISKHKGIEDNILIHGENLLALKELEKDYTEKVKCIYIDPSCNTKSLFKHYKDNLEHWKGGGGFGYYEMAPISINS